MVVTCSAFATSVVPQVMSFVLHLRDANVQVDYLCGRLKVFAD